MAGEVVTRWNGAFLVDGTRVVRSRLFPPDPVALAGEVELRRSGAVLPGEEQLITESGTAPLSTRDRRLVHEGVTLTAGLRRDPLPPLPAPDRRIQRAALLTAAEVALKSAWDPSIHVEEAVRAMTDLDQVLNRVGERLSSWSQRDAPALDTGDMDSVLQTAKRLVDGTTTASGESLGPIDPELASARKRLAELYLAVDGARKEIEAAVENALPHRAPNLTALLGPLIAARLLSQAGGIDRLSRLPASTIQVLGAERAFFDHLRGHAPPPKHGLLFLHPDIQGAPKRLRGKLARALAGKVAIGARMDREGAAVRPDLLSAFQARRTAIRALPTRRAERRDPRRSGPPLDRAAEDR